MVMEATPSPQSVGREFVRQYYTLLNKAPAHLHRFYNNSSSFVHGGLDAPNRESVPVIGQKQIHHLIQQLNFHDCHAKISQVDSQATLGNGVVVQVTGELSNGGEPMRRFTQTFVLASQSPKKYYVHNDIFRYQDYIIPDEDVEGTESGRSEGEDDPVQHMTAIPAVSVPTPTVVPTGTVTSIAATPAFYPHQPLPPPPAFVQAPVEVQSVALPTTPVPPVTPVPLVAPALNGHPPEDVLMAQALQAGLSTPLTDAPLEPTEIEEIPSPEEDIIAESAAVTTPTSQLEPAAPSVPPEPKTYANLLKSGGQTAFSQPILHNYNQSQYQSLPSARQYQSQSVAMPVTSNRSSAEGSAPANSAPNQRESNRGGSPGSQPQSQRTRPSRPPRQEHNQNNNDGGSTNYSASSGGGSGNRRYTDNLQVFLGNVPHIATEEELKTMFSRFGPVVELKIHGKTGSAVNAQPGARVPPNYGFVTYEDYQSVQNCLNAGPLYFPPDCSDGQKLNVEEKKTRTRGGGGAGGEGGAPRGPRVPRPSFSRGPHPHQAYRR